MMIDDVMRARLHRLPHYCFMTCNPAARIAPTTNATKHQTQPNIQPPNTSKGSYTSPAMFYDYVDAIMAEAVRRGVRYFVVVTPPPVCETCRAKSNVRGMLSACVRVCACACGRVEPCSGTTLP